MSDRILLDTDVAIDYLRGQVDAVAYVDSLSEPPLMSVIVVAELYAGVRDGEERTRLESFLRGLTIVAVSESMAVEGGLIRRQYGKSHGVGLDDALIAATANQTGGRVATLNEKHFPMLANILVPYRK